MATLPGGTTKYVIDPPLLESSAGNIEGVYEAMADCLTQLAGVVRALQGWNDPAQAAFMAKYEDFAPTLQNMVEELPVYAKAMRDHARRILDSEGSSVSDINNL